MNIAIFTDHYWPSQDAFSDYIQQLQFEFLKGRLGTIIVFCPFDERNKLQPNSTIFDQLNVIRIPSTYNKRRKMRQVDGFSKIVYKFILGHMISRKIDVVHIMSDGAMARYGRMVAIAAGVSVIATSINNYTHYFPTLLRPFIWMYLRWLYKTSRIVFTPTKTYANVMKRKKIYNVTELECNCSHDNLEILHKVYVVAANKPAKEG